MVNWIFLKFYKKWNGMELKMERTSAPFGVWNVWNVMSDDSLWMLYIDTGFLSSRDHDHMTKSPLNITWLRSNSTEWWRSTNHVIEIKNRIIDNYDKDLFNWTEAKDRKNIFGAAKSQTQYLAQPKNFFYVIEKNVKIVKKVKNVFFWEILKIFGEFSMS